MPEKLVKITIEPCPSCKGTNFEYHPPEDLKIHNNQVIVGKYTCTQCGWQSGLRGER